MTPRGAPREAVRRPELTQQQMLVVLGGLMLALLLAALDQTIVATALPTIVGDLGGLSHLSWVVTAYLLTSTAATPLYGKISDLYGRRGVFQSAIIIFLAGSVACGLAQTMTQLIVFRAIQGIGSGGLMSLTFAIVADVVPPRQRGRYQGCFGAVFGLSSVAGPLLGGLFTDHASWRWVFYVNLPVGMVAFGAVAAVARLPRRPRTGRVSVDLVGAVLLTLGVSGLLLVTMWGGTTWPWVSPQVLGTSGASLALLAGFVGWEARAVEPILPLRLFRLPPFRVSSALSLVSGFATFGAIVYLPEYQQVVKGDSAMMSGLLLLPITVGMILGSVYSGRAVSARGGYRLFPVLGSAIVGLGFWLLHYVGTATNQWALSVWMLVLGIGVGLYLQIVVLAAQDSVPAADLGTATSAISFFRTLGGAFGTAGFGAVLNDRLRTELGRLLPAAAHRLDPNTLSGAPSQLRTLPAAELHGLLVAFVRAFQTVFLAAVGVGVVSLVLSLLMPATLPVVEPASGGATNHAAPGAAARGPTREELAVAGVMLAMLAERVEHDPAAYPRLSRAVAMLTPPAQLARGRAGLTRRAQYSAATVLRPLALRTLVRAMLAPP